MKGSSRNERKITLVRPQPLYIRENFFYKEEIEKKKKKRKKRKKKSIRLRFSQFLTVPFGGKTRVAFTNFPFWTKVFPLLGMTAI
jgi:hypothetical protein